MASTYVNNLRLNEMATGDASGTWGTTTNTNLELIGEALGYGTEAITTNADTHTSTVADGSSDAARAMYVKYTGTLDSTCTITIAPNTMKRVQIIENATSGSQSIIISQGSGANVTIPTGRVSVVYLDGAGSGAAVVNAFTDLDLAGTLNIAGAVAAATDMTVGDDLTLSSDAGVLGFGADTDVTLTHVADTGLLLNSTRQLQFGDSGTYIHQSADGVLDLVSDTEIEINATTIDINGAVDISGNALVSGEVQTANIGYTDGDNAITIADGGGITAANGITSTAAANTLGATSFNDADITNVGDIQLDSITGDGDTNTSITFSGSDVITVATGGSTSFSAGATITTADNSDNLTLTSTDADANVGPVLKLRRNSSSPADDDLIGAIDWTSENSAGAEHDFLNLTARMRDVTDGSEDVSFAWTAYLSGTGREIQSFVNTDAGAASMVFNEDSQDIDFRVESNGNANMLFVDGGSDHVNIGTSTDLGGVLNVHSDDNADTLVAYSSDADSNEGPVVRLWRNSASPADGDNLGFLYFSGENSTDEKINYVELLGATGDVTNATEDGVFNIQTMVAGTSRSRILVNSTEVAINDASQDLDFRVESNGNANMLFVNGGDDRVGIGADPTQGNTLEIYGNSDGNVNALGLWNASDAGTNDSVSMNMYLTGSGGTVSAASIYAEKVEDWSSGTSRSASLRFNVRRDGTDDLHLVLGSLGDGLYGARLPNGVRFGSDTATANSLDDYEEGTFTPSIAGVSGTFVGHYTKIGDLVTCCVACSGLSGTASASVIGGFPFTAANTTQKYGIAVANMNNFNLVSQSGKQFWSGHMLANTSTCQMYAGLLGGANDSSNVYSVWTNVVIEFSVSYKV